jgi:hypothetical protein
MGDSLKVLRGALDGAVLLWKSSWKFLAHQPSTQA